MGISTMYLLALPVHAVIITGMSSGVAARAEEKRKPAL